MPIDAKLRWNRRFLEKLSWRPTDFNIEPPLKFAEKKGKFHPFNLTHHGLHYLISERYLLPIGNTPQITLLCEAIASGSDVFFAAEYFKHSRYKHSMVKENFENWQIFWDIKTSEIEYYLLESETSAYRLFQKVALEMFKFLNISLRWSTTAYPNSSELKLFQKELSKMQYRFFYEHYDIQTFLLYTLGFCTTQSSRWDLEAMEDLLSVLKESKTMLQFLKNIAEPYQFKNKRPAKLKNFAEQYRQV